MTRQDHNRIEVEVTSQMYLTGRSVLLDMDGTLVDSSSVVNTTWGKFADNYGLDVEEVLDFAHGRPTLSTVQHFLRDAVLAAKVTRQIVTAEELATEGIKPVRGAAQFLAGLCPADWCVVTSATRALAERRLHVAGLPQPSFMISSEDISVGKPDPTPFIKAAHKMGISVKDCIAIEDSPPGITSALASGAVTVSIGTKHLNMGQHGHVTDFASIVVSKYEGGYKFRIEDQR